MFLDIPAEGDCSSGTVPGGDSDSPPGLLTGAATRLTRSQWERLEEEEEDGAVEEERSENSDENGDDNFHVWRLLIKTHPFGARNARLFSVVKLWAWYDGVNARLLSFTKSALVSFPSNFGQFSRKKILKRAYNDIGIKDFIIIADEFLLL